MQKSKKLYGLICLVVIGTFLACSEEVSSKPSFVFKPAPNKSVAAKIMGKDVSHDELFKSTAAEIYEAEMKVYEIKLNRIKAEVLKRFMESDPAYKGDNDQFINKVVGKVSVSDKQIMAFAKERNIPKENLNDQLKGRIRQFLERDIKAKKVDQWLAQKTKKMPVHIYLEKPKRPVADVKVGNAAAFGPADAKVTIVEFSDFQCPFCSKGAKVINDIKKKYGNKVRVAFKNYPLPFHADAKVAAVAGLCANEQNSKLFWKLHDVMFENQGKLKEPDLIAAGKNVGVDTQKFNECLKSRKYLAQVETEMKEGQAVGVKSTPTFFVNGMLVSGAQPLEVFSELIDEELSK